MFLQQLLGLVNCAAHPLGVGSQNQVSAVRRQKAASLFAHRIRHGQNEPVTFYRRDQCQAYPSIAAGRFNDGGAGLKFPLAFGDCDHVETNTILHRPAGVERLHLSPYFRVVFSRKSSQSHDGRGADEIQNGSGAIYACHRYARVSGLKSNSNWLEKNGIFLTFQSQRN